jgi:hypothetical protein
MFILHEIITYEQIKNAQNGRFINIWIGYYSLASVIIKSSRVGTQITGIGELFTIC